MLKLDWFRLKTNLEQQYTKIVTACGVVDYMQMGILKADQNTPRDSSCGKNERIWRFSIDSQTSPSPSPMGVKVYKDGLNSLNTSLQCKKLCLIQRWHMHPPSRLSVFKLLAESNRGLRWLLTNWFTPHTYQSLMKRKKKLSHACSFSFRKNYLQQPS